MMKETNFREEISSSQGKEKNFNKKLETNLISVNLVREWTRPIDIFTATTQKSIHKNTQDLVNNLL